MKCKICGNNSYGEYCFRHKPRSKPRNNSLKRKKQMDLYKALGESLKPLKTDNTKCFFCGGTIKGAGYDKHHLLGRENLRLLDERLLVKVHHVCHMDYHHSSWKKLSWWNNYLLNLSLDDKYAKVLSKEQIKMTK